MAECHGISPNAPTGVRLLHWVDHRFPVSRLVREHMTQTYAPKNLNIWYVFGSLARMVFAIQIITGIFLAMHYKPDAALAFASVEYIMRDVPWGWLIRYMHSTGASAFFVVMYLHIFGGLIYGRYRKPRELVWFIGCAIFLVMMASAFMGYLLPWGQMSYWGAQVIINLFSAIPWVGPDIALLIRGDFVVGDATLNRFYSMHIIAVPLVLLGLVMAHVIAANEVSSNRPDRIEIKANKDTKEDTKGMPLNVIPFHPYYTVHSIFALSIFLLIFFAIVFFAPEMGGYFLEYNNFIPADPLHTPAHISPVWYFTPYYTLLRAITSEMMLALSAIVTLGVVWAILKIKMPFLFKVIIAGAAFVVVVSMIAIDTKFWGVVAMGGGVVILIGLPWLDRSPIKSIRYRPTWHQFLYAVFVLNFLLLGYLGTLPVSVISGRIAQLGTLFYFSFFILMPWWSRLGSAKPLPQHVTFMAH